MTRPTSRQRRSPLDGAGTRKALHDAALELFTEHGVDAVSIRAVNAKADRALAAVHYHFGSKDALIRAVLRWGGDQVGQRTVDLARQMLASGATPTGLRIVRLIGVAYAELLQLEPVRGWQWLSVVEQTSVTHREEYSGHSESIPLLVGLLQAADPQVTPDVVEEWFKVASQVLLEIAHRSPRQPDAIPSRTTGLVELVAGGLDSVLAAYPRSRTE